MATIYISGVAIFQGWPYFRGGLISGLSNFRGGHILGVATFQGGGGGATFQGWPHFRGGHISGVAKFQGWPHFRGGQISGVQIRGKEILYIYSDQVSADGSIQLFKLTPKCVYVRLF